MELLVIAGNGISHLLTAFLPSIKTIIKDDMMIFDDTNQDKLTEMLLMAELFSITFTPKNIINLIYRS